MLEGDMVQEPATTKQEYAAVGSTESTPLLQTGSIDQSASDNERWRWPVLVLCCFIAIGVSFCSDNPTALHDAMIDDLKISNAVFTSFYSWYNWPNVVLCFFGGVLIDRIGRRVSGPLFTSMILLGQLCFASGALISKIWLMQLGRIIFGIGAESLSTVLNTFLASWFLSKELNFAFGFTMCFGRLGSSVNMYTTLPLYKLLSKYVEKDARLGTTLFITAGICLLSVFSATCLGFLDKKYNRSSREVANSRADKPNISVIKRLPAELWLLAMVCAAYYVAVFPFIAVGVRFFELRYELNDRMASILDSFVFVSSAVIAPFLGAFVDIVGRNVYFVILSTFLTSIAHILLASGLMHPLLPMIVFGIGYSIMSAFLWPMIVLIVPPENIGIGFGLVLSIQNLALGTMNMLSGYIIDYLGYFSLQLILIGFLFVALTLALQLLKVDRRLSRMLSMSARERKQLLTTA